MRRSRAELNSAEEFKVKVTSNQIKISHKKEFINKR